MAATPRRRISDASRLLTLRFGDAALERGFQEQCFRDKEPDHPPRVVRSGRGRSHRVGSPGPRRRSPAGRRGVMTLTTVAIGERCGPRIRALSGQLRAWTPRAYSPKSAIPAHLPSICFSHR